MFMSQGESTGEEEAEDTREGRSLMKQVGWEEKGHPEAGLREALGAHPLR